MNIFTFGSGHEVSFDNLCDLSFNKYDRINTKFIKFDNKNPTAILHRFSNCVLSGNLLRDSISTIVCDGIATRPDMYNLNNRHDRYPLVKNITNDQYNNVFKTRKKIGFLFRTLRDTNYAMFICGCVPMMLYLKKILNNSYLKNEKIYIIIGGEEGGWVNHRGQELASILQSKFINEIKKEYNVSWKDIHNEFINKTAKGNKFKEIIIEKIKKWKNEENMKNFTYNEPLENWDIVFDLCYIIEIMQLLCEPYNNIEIILQNNDLAFEKLFVPAALSSNFCNMFPKLNPPVESVFKELSNTCFKKIKFDKYKKNERFYISRTDSMDGQHRYIENSNKLNKLLSDLSFSFINASYYSTIEKYELFYYGKIFILEEGAGIANWTFFPENSIIIILSNKAWDSYTKKYSKSWWILWNNEHLSFLNHKIYLYENINICNMKNAHEITSKINDINHFNNFISNLL